MQRKYETGSIFMATSPTEAGCCRSAARLFWRGRVGSSPLLGSVSQVGRLGCLLVWIPELCGLLTGKGCPGAEGCWGEAAAGVTGGRQPDLRLDFSSQGGEPADGPREAGRGSLHGRYCFCRYSLLVRRIAFFWNWRKDGGTECRNRWDKFPKGTHAEKGTDT